MACDDTQKDPKLTDTCISLSKQPQWWLSEDIKLNGTLFNGTNTSKPADQAIFMQDNTIDVRVRRANQACLLPSDGEIDTSRIKIVVYIAVPGANLKPNLKGPMGEKLVIQIGTALFMTTSGQMPDLPASGIKSLSEIGQAITWKPTSTNDKDADGKGPNANSHRCLIVRCFPELGPSPDPDCFHIVADQHVAQHNIDIVSGSNIVNGLVWTSNSNDEERELATLRLVADLNPEPRVVEILTPALQATPGYQRIARTSPVSFGLELPDFPDAKVCDNTRLGCLGRILKALGLGGSTFEPKYEADIQLQPGQVTSFNFTVDLSRSQPGDAHIFHLMHVRSDQQVIGGLTIGAVAV
jgi:hypothetical protein